MTAKLTTQPHTFAASPTTRLEFTHGKVSGSVVLAHHGHGVVIGTEGAHVNDDRPAIEYNGDRFIGRVWIIRDASGSWVVNLDNLWNDTKGGVLFTQTANWSNATKTANRMITEALLQVANDNDEWLTTNAPEAHRAEAERAAFRVWSDAKAAQDAHDKAARAYRAATRALAKATATA